MADLDSEIADWQRRAEMAVRASDDGLAKEGRCAAKGRRRPRRGEAKKALQEQSVYADQLTAALRQLDERLKQIELRQGTLKAKARANRDGNPLSGKTSAFNDFDRMAGRIDAVEAEAGLDEQLSGGSPSPLPQSAS